MDKFECNEIQATLHIVRQKTAGSISEAAKEGDPIARKVVCAVVDHLHDLKPEECVCAACDSEEQLPKAFGFIIVFPPETESWTIDDEDDVEAATAILCEACTDLSDEEIASRVQAQFAGTKLILRQNRSIN